MARYFEIITLNFCISPWLHFLSMSDNSHLCSSLQLKLSSIYHCLALQVHLCLTTTLDTLFHVQSNAKTMVK